MNVQAYDYHQMRSVTVSSRKLQLAAHCFR
jgi:hypothetical protein